MSFHPEYMPLAGYPGYVTVAIPPGGEPGQTLVLDPTVPGLLAWGQPLRGEKGDTGPAGPVGPAGPAGKDGKDGRSIVGPRGIPGRPGKDGESIVGPAGPTGPRGPVGRAGIRGRQGPAGRDGEDGVDGRTIVGPQGPSGPRGRQGPPGPINVVDGLKLHAKIDKLQKEIDELRGQQTIKELCDPTDATSVEAGGQQ